MTSEEFYKLFDFGGGPDPYLQDSTSELDEKLDTKKVSRYAKKVTSFYNTTKRKYRLTWTSHPLGKYNKFNSKEKNYFCEYLGLYEYGGIDEWRLPTDEELYDMPNKLKYIKDSDGFVYIATDEEFWNKNRYQSESKIAWIRCVSTKRSNTTINDNSEISDVFK